jgi:hypothetical protein
MAGFLVKRPSLSQPIPNPYTTKSPNP